MGKIENLTEAQEANLPTFRDEWLKIGLSTTPVDRDISTAAVEELYEAAGEAKPMVIHLDSPAQCIMAINLFRKLEGEATEAVQLRDQLGVQLGGQLGGQLWGQLGVQLGGQLWVQLRDQLWVQLRDQLGDQLRGQLRGQLDSINTYIWGGQDAPWIAFYEFGRSIGVKYENSDHFDAYINYAKTSGWLYAYKGLAFVSDRPELIMKDDQGRLHGEDGPAIRFRDGYSVFAFNGVRIDERFVMERKTIDPSEALAIQDVDVRTAACACIGWARMLDKLDHKIIDSDPNPDHGDLLEVALPGLPNPGRYLKATCPRNGPFMEGVPNETQTVIGAHAWRHGENPNTYQFPTERT